MDQKQKELIEHCDAVVWASEFNTEDNTIQTMMNFYRTKNKVKPTDTGYKYSVLQFRTGDSESIEVFHAIIGSPKCYAERLGSMGYNGVMLKQKSCKKSEAKDLFTKSLLNWGFDEKESKGILKQLV